MAIHDNLNSNLAKGVLHSATNLGITSRENNTYINMYLNTAYFSIVGAVITAKKACKVKVTVVASSGNSSITGNSYLAHNGNVVLTVSSTGATQKDIELFLSVGDTLNLYNTSSNGQYWGIGVIAVELV